ncbi:GbsR/MarR family transcriptional regulator [Microbacterium sp. ISL-59]|uniref:GbsR/MarR family transcriptional regulator n=1 Tax=Microbacterium sp. ISL-59 TaxID=2819159 RepID=UPI0020358099|nr:MarR family transcriptional regulator [Microbacterium sp. ISL-59]
MPDDSTENAPDVDAASAGDAVGEASASDSHRGVEPAEQAAAMMTAAGMPRMPARVMMALVAAPDGGYTAAQLGERLGVSAAAVSGAVRYLQQLHFIQRRSRPGDRRDRYEFVHDPFYRSIVGNMPVYARLSEYIDDIAAEHDEDQGAHDRAVELAEFFRFLSVRMLQIVEDWRDHRRD